MTYTEKLRDPRWQKKRLEIMERDKWTCVVSGRTDLPLCVHHQLYFRNPWDCPGKYLETICMEIHEIIHPFDGMLRDRFPKKAIKAKDIFHVVFEVAGKMSDEEYGGDFKACIEDQPIWKFQMSVLAVFIKRFKK